MNILIILFFVFMGFYGQLVNFLKQTIFQGKDIVGSPWMYLRNTHFMISSVGLTLFAQIVWVVDAIVRQRITYSKWVGYTALLVAPISSISTLFALYLSEQHLADRVVWWAAILLVIGNAFAMVGGSYLLGGNK